ncbi:hypothetical protein BV25DRAFT_830896 [Artomyces pyxidatus]|uniref:Uncharacterized protein n=1 Tax=Artomyces pyxidatus TaxID=48021 RepID=A0ACB8SWU0_9AGAM|nr:hypothetical protein BV25DRAFT_830896 [Artomyces pyxidatus]
MPLRLQGLEVCLISDGNEIPRYREEVLDERTISCYVPSKEGKEFQIILGASDVPLAWSIYMDGRRMEGWAGVPGVVGRITGSHTSPLEVRPFCFSRLQLTDDDAHLHQHRARLEKLGSIEVRVCRAQFSHSRVLGDVAPVPEIGIVPERAKKNGWHCVSLGPPKQADLRSTRATVRLFDDPEAPYAKFYFRYQPEELLQAKGIMPLVKREHGEKRGRSSNDDLDDRQVKRQAVGDFNPAQLARIRALKDSIRAAEAELATLDSTSIKREPSPIRLVRSVGPSGQGGIIIDLTLDD